MPLARAEAPARFFGYYPGTVTVITAAYRGVRNAMAAGWHAALSVAPPMYGVAVGRTRASHPLICSSGRFAVHFFPFDRAELIAAVGSVSLAELNGEDKFCRFGLATLDTDAQAPPLLRDAYLAYVCRVASVTPTGDHDWIAGELEAIYYDAAAFDDQRLVDLRMPVPIYLGRSSYLALTEAAPRVRWPPERFGKQL